MKAYIGGTFDLFHVGHVRLFQAAKEKFGYVCVAINTDEFAERYKRKPIMTLDERGSVVAACSFVDEIIVNEEGEDSKPTILKVKPDVIVHGDDWTGEGLMKQMGLTQEFLDEHSIMMEYLPYTAGISTSDIIKRIHERQG